MCAVAMAPPLEDPELEDKDKGTPPALDEDDIKLLKTYGVGPYAGNIKKLEEEVKDLAKKVNELKGIKESDTGLAQPSHWDLVSDKQAMQEEQPLQVARCTKIINPNTDDAKVKSESATARDSSKKRADALVFFSLSLSFRRHLSTSST